MAFIHTRELPWQSTPVKGVTVKELVHQPHGTAKLIRLAPGAEYPTHQHPDRDEYVYVLSGTLTASVFGEPYEALPGDFTLVPKGTPHALANYTDQDVTTWVGAIMPGGSETR